MALRRIRGTPPLQPAVPHLLAFRCPSSLDFCQTKLARFGPASFRGSLSIFRFQLAIVMQKLNAANKFGAGLLFDSAGSHIGSDVADVETFDVERSESKIVHGCDGFGHQSSVPIGSGDPKSATALWVVRLGAKMNVSYGLAITRLQHQSPLINFFTRGNFFQLLLDKGFRTVTGDMAKALSKRGS